MLSHFKNLLKLSGQVIKKCEFQNSFLARETELLAGARCGVCIKNRAENFHTSTPRNRISREIEYRKAAKYDAKREGRIQDSFGGDLNLKRKEGYFPTVDLPNTLFDGIPFRDLPIVKIKATRNNTLLSLIDQGSVKISRSCGTEGFKNARKGTNVAAQAAGAALGYRAVRMGYKMVKVLLGGLGAGRLSSIKGLQLGGLGIVSITDCTIDRTQLRPRKQRRI